MLELLFGVLTLIIFGKIFVFAVKAAWGISKILVTVILIPLFIIGLILKGLFLIAVPILIIAGVCAFILN